MRLVLAGIWLLVSVFSFSALLSPEGAAGQKEDSGLVLMFIPGANFDRLAPGVSSKSYLEIRNASDKVVSNIRLSSDKPAGWEVEFKPDVINQLNAGGVTTVDVNIKPPESATRGDYRFTAMAEADAIKRITSIYVNVQPATTTWMWIGLALAALLIAGFVLVFIRMGR